MPLTNPLWGAPHIKNETAEPWGRAGGLAHFWIGTGNFGGWGRPIQYPLFTGDDAQLATALKDNSGHSDKWLSARWERIPLGAVLVERKPLRHAFCFVCGR